MSHKSSVSLLALVVHSACLVGCFSRSVSEKVVQVPVTRDVVVHDSSSPDVVVEHVDPDGRIVREQKKVTITERHY
jgi:hypothetical protein